MDPLHSKLHKLVTDLGLTTTKQAESEEC